MNKNKCSLPYEQMRQERRGSKPKTPQGQRKQIDGYIHKMQVEEDFWTLESVRRILKRICRYEEASYDVAFLIDRIADMKDEEIARTIQYMNVFRGSSRPRAQ